MTLDEIAYFSLSAAGLTVILVYSTLFEPVRSFLSARSDKARALINCPMCMGFWVGIVSSVVYFHTPVFASGCIASLVSWILANLIDAVQSIGTYFESALETEE